MDERCSKLYSAIKVAYEDMVVRQDVKLSKILLSASNEVIKSRDAGLCALHLDRDLNLYNAHTDLTLPRGVEELKKLTQKCAAEYYEKKRSFKVDKATLRRLGGKTR